MTQAVTKQLNFTEFIRWKPEGGRYELHDGIIVEMQPTGKHEEITGFLATELAVEYKRLKLPYFFPKTALVKSNFRESAYSPDVLILNRLVLREELLWEKYSTVQIGNSIPLIVEVVSTNWRDDYLTKVRDYEEIGVREYWIVDYLGLGGKRYIGSPKQSTISVYQLVEGEYQVDRFTENQPIESLTFPELNLTAKTIFQAGETSS
jgi:Uma2 family endonuclease